MGEIILICRQSPDNVQSLQNKIPYQSKRRIEWVILMLHSENRVEEESAKTIAGRARVGLMLLFVFAFVYFGFIFLCAFANSWFASLEFWGVPATVWYGFGLIALTLVIAGVYGRLSRTIAA